MVHEPWWTAVARRADIVLPATTTLERDDIGSAARDRFILAMKQAIPPQAQARDDFAIFADIADALGVRDRFTEQRDIPAWLRAIYERGRRAAATQDVELPDFDAFWAKGHVEVLAAGDRLRTARRLRREPGGEQAAHAVRPDRDRQRDDRRLRL